MNTHHTTYRRLLNGLAIMAIAIGLPASAFAFQHGGHGGGHGGGGGHHGGGGGHHGGGGGHHGGGSGMSSGHHHSGGYSAGGHHHSGGGQSHSGWGGGSNWGGSGYRGGYGGGSFYNNYRGSGYRGGYGGSGFIAGYGLGALLGGGYGGYGLGYGGYGSGYGGYGSGYGGYGYGLSYGNGYGNYNGAYAAPVYVPQTVVAPNSSVPAAQSQDSFAQSSDGFAERGEQAFRARNYKQAVYEWKHATVDQPQNGALLLLLAQSLFATGQYNEAAGATQLAMQVLPQDQWGLVSSKYRELYSNITDYTTQLRALEAAVKAKPDEPAQHFLLGYHYSYLGYPSNGLTQLDKTLTLAPQDKMARELRKLMAAKVPDAPPAPPPAPPLPDSSLTAPKGEAATAPESGTEPERPVVPPVAAPPARGPELRGTDT